MFSRDFLERMADTYGLTPDQKEVFGRRLLENKSHQEIAEKLNISVQACLRRMAEVYKKFGLQEGRGRGKDAELRKLLLDKLEHSQVVVASDASLLALSERVSAIENTVTQDSQVSPTTIRKEESCVNPSSEYLHNCHNIPPQTNEFIGREKDLKMLLKYLSEDHASPIVTIDGIGGVGKTALVLEAAYRCLKARNAHKSANTPEFDAIIFVSAKENYLLPTGIVPRPDAQKTLGDVYRAIAYVLKNDGINRATNEREQYQLVKECLSKQRTLLIVDNLETLEEQEKQRVMGFLHDLPRNVKSVITTREQRTIYVQIRLDKLPEKDSKELIQQQAKEKSLTLTDEEVKKLHQACGGIPLVIVYAVGRQANSVSLETVLEDLRSAKGDLAHFLFKKSVDELKEQPAHKLLMALAIFHKPPIREALVEVAGLKTDPKSIINNALEQLQQLSLVRQYEGRYRMLSLTREYALAELVIYPNFEKEVRERWYQWYLKFAQEYGGDDWNEWHNQYDFIDSEWSNFLAVLDWCAVHNRYSDFKDLWQQLNKFASLYAYWDDRLKRLDWLIQASEQRGDWETYVEMTTAKGWTLTLKESPVNLAKADKLQQKAWHLHEHASPVVQYTLADNIAVLRIRQGRYEEAIHWTNIYKNLLTKAEVDERLLLRADIRCRYYEAEILYREERYEESKTLYREIVEQAKEIGWLRFECNAQDWLASIAIIQNDLEEAERLSKISLPVAERNRDRRRTACCQYTRARLEKAKGNLKEAYEWANKALKNFESLGIQRDAEEIYSFLKEIT